MLSISVLKKRKQPCFVATLDFGFGVSIRGSGTCDLHQGMRLTLAAAGRGCGRRASFDKRTEGLRVSVEDLDH